MPRTIGVGDVKTTVEHRRSKRSNQPILFLGHEASRTGAPMVLLHFLRWLKQNTSHPFRIMLLRGGELEPDFRALGPTTVVVHPTWRKWRGVRRAADLVGLRAAGERLYRNRLWTWANTPHPAALVYVNTVAAVPMVETLAPFACPVLCHMHELGFGVLSGVGQQRFSQLLRETDEFIACARVVRDYLVEAHGVAGDRVATVHEFIPTTDSRRAAHGDRRDARARVIHELGVPHDALFVGGAGSMSWRKGIDLFVQVAGRVIRQHPQLPVHFVWFGDVDPGCPITHIEYDIRRCGVHDRVHLPGVKANLPEYLAGLDVFVLPSREDPYPLVCLEAAAGGCPIICFDGAGGMPEFVENDCGIVVPYLGITEMATAIAAVCVDPMRRRRLADVGRRKVRTRHDVSIGAPQVYDVMRHLIDSGGSGDSRRRTDKS